jgi:hypothetical protein
MPTGDKLASQTPNASRYHKVQIKAWTDFDPTTVDLKQMAEHIERGHGAITAIEVVKIADSLSGVDDVEVRERFETLQAVDRVMQNVDAIPKALLERLLEQLISGGDDSAKTQAA